MDITYYYIPGLTGILFIVMLLMSENFPTYFLIGIWIMLVNKKENYLMFRLEIVELHIYII